MLGASRDTVSSSSHATETVHLTSCQTAILLTSVIYAFTQHPEVLARLREEILDVCPKGHVPTYGDIRRLKYCEPNRRLKYSLLNSPVRAVLNETLRVFPAVPANTRSVRDQPVAVPVPANKEDSRPLYMPAKAPVAYFPILILKRKDLWGPDAYQYDPDRWMDDGSGRMERVVKNPFMFLPFHAGPRIVSWN
jgi:cytochrome P450